MGRIHGENTDLTGSTQVRVPATRHKYHRPRHKIFLDGYDNFSNYLVVGSLRDTNNFGRLDVWRCMMILKAIRVVSRLSHNNNNKRVLSTLFVPYICKIQEQLFSKIEQLQ